jgi:hypothetical protein
LVKRLIWCWLMVVGLQAAVAVPLRLAVQNSGEPVEWDLLGLFSQTGQPPLLMVSLPFPPEPETAAPQLPPPRIPVLLQLEFSGNGEAVTDQSLDRLGALLSSFQNISHLSLRGWQEIEDFNRLAYTLKRIASLARGIRPGIRIAAACSGGPDDSVHMTLLETLATNPDTSAYFDCFFLDTGANEKIRHRLLAKAPHLRFWEAASLPNGGGEEEDPDPCRILAGILEDTVGNTANTSLLVIPFRRADMLYPLLWRFSAYLQQALYRDGSTIEVRHGDGSSSAHPLFFRAHDHAPVLFLGDGRDEEVEVVLKEGLYKRALVENLRSGERAVFKIHKNAAALMLSLNGDCFALHLVPRQARRGDSRYHLQVTGRYRLSAAEIIARVRAWKARQQLKLRSFTATMTTSLRLRIANLNQTFDLTIKGPVFTRRNEPYDWVWREFFINGVRWKSKQVPKIPLLQPEKVNILPLDINLTEAYRYSLAGETTLAGQPAYIIDFSPRREDNAVSSYRGRIWVHAGTFAVLKEHLIQLHLKGEVLSNVETRIFKPLKPGGEIRLPLTVTGHQVFSTAGRITNVERRVSLSDVVINPPDFDDLRAEAYRSDFQMVRDTQKGLRYLVKDQKSGTRSLEPRTKKSQLFGLVGGFYDSSFDYPIPILGVNYMNFDLGGKGRQVNILFGGAMLTANYSDPAFLNTKMDLGANLVAVAFPFANRLYRQGTEMEAERLKHWPVRFQVNTGFPLGPYFKFSSFFFLEYTGFSRAKTTSDDFILPPSTFTLGWRSRLTVNFKGFRLALWGEMARRGRWQFWGRPGNDRYDQNQRSYLRWRAVLTRDFFLSKFRKFNITAGYFDGRRLDRFSAYKFGFFNELNLHGYMSGVVQASRAFMLNLSYGYSLGRAFRLEANYDSIWVTSPYRAYRNTYFSGAALSGTMNIPWLKGILRFEVGLPVVSNGIKGLVLYFVLLKMF